MGSVSKQSNVSKVLSNISNVSKVSKVLSNMSKVRRCFASNCSEISVS